MQRWHSHLYRWVQTGGGSASIDHMARLARRLTGGGLHFVRFLFKAPGSQDRSGRCACRHPMALGARSAALDMLSRAAIQRIKAQWKPSHAFSRYRHHASCNSARPAQWNHERCLLELRRPVRRLHSGSADARCPRRPTPPRAAHCSNRQLLWRYFQGRVRHRRGGVALWKGHAALVARVAPGRSCGGNRLNRVRESTRNVCAYRCCHAKDRSTPHGTLGLALRSRNYTASGCVSISGRTMSPATPSR